MPLRGRPRNDGPWAGASFQSDLAALLDPPPPTPRLAPGVFRVVARVVLWMLVAVGALRGLLPGPQPPVAPPAAVDGRATAVAAAFLREYLTTGDGATGWRTRLRPFMATGAELGKVPHARSGTSRYADLVLPAGTRPVGGALEVTVLAHVVELRGGRYRPGKLLAYVVRVTTATGGVVVSGAPHRASLPFEPSPDEGEQAAGRSLPSLPAAEPPRTETRLERATTNRATAELALAAADRRLLGAAGLARLAGG